MPLVRLLLASAMLALAPQPPNSALTPEAVLTAWTARRQAIGAFQCQAFVQEDCTVTRFELHDDPLAVPPGTPQQVRLRYEVTLKRRGPNMSVERIGDATGLGNPLPLTRRRELSTCNIDETRMLVDSALPVPNMGVVVRGELQRRYVPSFASAMPAWLWYDPVGHMEEIGYTLATADSEPDPRGDEPVTLVFANSAVPSLAIRLEADRKLPHLVRRYTAYNDEIVIARCELVYDETAKHVAAVGPPLKLWTYARLSENGAVDSRRQGHVTALTYPVAFTDADFTFEFPVGTHISDSRRQESRTYWLQVSPTERRRLKSAEFGAPNAGK